MCGIAGLVNLYGRLSPEVMKATVTVMADKMVYRGPDDFGIWLDGTGFCAFSHRRLSIIDPSPTGHQPMLSSDGKACITFNGEIYNFQDMREELEAKGHIFKTRTDTEVLIDAILTYGDSVYSKIDGMYAFGFFNKEKRELILARDPFGKKPLYYTEVNRFFAFASELHALSALPNFDATIDDESIAEYLAFKYIHAPRTIYRDVKKLLPGHFLKLSDNGNIVVRKHFEFTPVGSAGRITPLDDLADELEEILIRCVKRRLISDVPLGAFLSGGVDSSLIVAVMSKILGHRVKTFSIGFEGDGESEHIFARQMAQHLDTEHHEKILKPDITSMAKVIGCTLDEPNADSSCLPTYILSEFARQQVAVALSGDGGDEMFGGYELYFSTLQEEDKFKSGDPNYKNWNPADAYFSNGLLLFTENDLTQLLGRIPQETNNLLLSLRQRLNKTELPLLSRMRQIDVNMYMPGAVLAKVDRMSMQHSLEVRSPLLSIEVARFAERLNPESCYSGGQGKLVLKQLGGRYIPKQWLTRRKTGFGLPDFTWDRKELLNIARSLLLGKRAMAQNWTGIKNMRDFIAKQENLDAFNLSKVWSLLILEIWLRSHRSKISGKTEKPLRMAFLTPEFVTEQTMAGGLAVYTDRITRTLRDMGHEPEVFTLAEKEPGVIYHNNVRIERVARRDARLIHWLRRLSSLHRNLNIGGSLHDLGGALSLAYALVNRDREKPFDFVHCSDYGLTSLFVKKRTDRPVLVRCSWARDLFTSVDGSTLTLDNWLINFLERLSIRRATLAYAPSLFVAKHMWQKHKIKLSVLRPPFFLEQQPTEQIPDELPTRYLIHFGLLGKRKGTDVLAKALPMVWQVEPDLMMVWAGQEHCYSIVEESRQLWGDRANQVKWLGPIERPVLYAILKKAEAAVLPSRCDNLPNTVIESLLFGVPVIGTDGASIDELVEPGVCGELVPIENATALAQAMIRVWRGERMLNGRPTTLREMNPKVAAFNLLNIADSAVIKSGRCHIVRLFFLNWLIEYLSKQEVKDSKIWNVFQAFLQYRHSILFLLFPTFYRLLNRVRLFLIRLNQNMAKLNADSGTATVYEGTHDGADCNMISGWAWDMNRPDTPIYVDIYDGSTLLATLKADEFRQDLVYAGKGNGRHAFNFVVPLWLKDGKPHSILVRVSGTDFDLSSTPRQIVCGFETIEKALPVRALKLLARRLF
jgi:asparagine synthase (glutamine-hydrolysing)